MLRISTIIETLASIGSPVSTREHVGSILGGLPPEYDSLVSTVTAFVSRDDILSLAELETMILAQEARLEQAKAVVIQEPLSINLAQTASVPNGIPNVNLEFQQPQMSNPQPNTFQNLPSQSQGGFNNFSDRITMEDVAMVVLVADEIMVLLFNAKSVINVDMRLPRVNNVLVAYP